ncbi:MAG: 50S ribosomal protein L19e [Candidatus Pacearchaeota archaeon]|jgi:large subunit ribosomal protein L19e
MNLSKKKELASKTLKVGKNKLIFNQEALSEIKEAITKEDIRTLYQEGMITLKPNKGRRTIVKRKTRKGPGKIRKKIKTRKQDYVKITRKLRKYVKMLKMTGQIDRDFYLDLRKKIKLRTFKSLANLKEYLETIKHLGLKEATRKSSSGKGKSKKKSKK